jgi:hypothetical protein
MRPNFRSVCNMQSSTCGAFRNSTSLIWRDSYGGKKNHRGRVEFMNKERGAGGGEEGTQRGGGHLFLTYDD